MSQAPSSSRKEQVATSPPAASMFSKVGMLS